MINVRLPLLVFMSFVLYACSKTPVNPGVENTITGHFYDSLNNEAYPNLKVRLAEYRPKSSFLGTPSEELIGYADSTHTDATGHYKLSFTSNGDGRNFFIEFTGLPGQVYVTPTVQGEGYTGNGGNYYQRLQIKPNGGPATYNFEIIKQYYMQVRIIVHNDPYPPLNVITGNTRFQLGSTGNEIYGADNDTTEYVGIVKNTGGFNLYFTVYNPASQTYLSDTAIWLNPLINRDTIQGGTYNVYPSTFK